MKFSKILSWLGLNSVILICIYFATTGVPSAYNITVFVVWAQAILSIPYALFPRQCVKYINETSKAMGADPNCFHVPSWFAGFVDLVGVVLLASAGYHLLAGLWLFQAIAEQVLRVYKDIEDKKIPDSQGVIDI